MRIMFIHQNMPGQYRGLMPHVVANPENQVVAIGEADNIRRNFNQVPQGLKLLGYQMPQYKQPEGHPFLTSTEHFTYRGETLAKALVDLKKQGFSPDVICSHPGWGESLFIKDVYPDARLINYCEFYYNTHGRDFNFDPEFPEKPHSEWSLRPRNAIQLLSLSSMDAGISPMEWQASSFPPEYRSKISVIHEGVDTARVAPDPTAAIVIKEAGITLTAKDEVITYVSRNLEPYRGFHTFMRALPEILEKRPNARVLIVGGDEVSYGKTVVDMTYRQMMLRELGAKLDKSRVFFLGKIPYNDYLRLLQISAAHIYLTYPFVLSWSMLEAMSVGCLIVGSRTAPVMEVLEDGKNGLLVDFFSPKQVAEATIRACESKNRMQELRDRARQLIIDKFDFKSVCLPQQLNLIEGKPLTSARAEIPAIKPAESKSPESKIADLKAPEIKTTEPKPAERKTLQLKQTPESKPPAEKPAATPSAAPRPDPKKASARPVVGGKPTKGKK